MFKVGQKVLISNDAFGDSVDENDLAARGKVGIITRDLADELAGFVGCYAVDVPELFDEVLVIDDELTLIDTAA